MSSKKAKKNNTVLIRKSLQVPISQLSDDCLINIFSLLPIVDRIRIQRVCKRWRSLSLLSWSSCKTLTLDLEDWGIDYGVFRRITRIMLRDVLKLCGNYVTCIDFSRYFSEWDTRKSIKGSKNLFEEFKKFCPNLASLRLSTIKVTLKGIEYLAKNYSNLREIEMIYHFDCNEAMSLLFRNNRNLRCLNLFTPELSGKRWLDLNPLAIEEIHLSSWLEDANDFRIALERFINLRIFEIEVYREREFATYIDEFLEAISSHGKKLKTLIINCYENSVNLRSIHFKYFENLQEFTLSGSQIKIDDKFFKAFSNHCTKITRLHLNRLDVTDFEISHIFRLPKLRVLDLKNLREVTDAIFFNRIPSLRKLYCSECPQLGNLGLREFLHESATNLERFNVDKCANIDLKLLIQDAKEATKERVSGPLLRMLVSRKRTSYTADEEKTSSSQYFELTEYFS